VYGIGEQFAQEFDALIDTGFTGFLMLPLTSAIPLGLTLCGTSRYTLADGTVSSSNLIALGTVEFEGQKVLGPISLEGNTACKDCLLGMEYIKQSKQMLVVCEAVAALYDMEEVLKIMQDAAAATQVPRISPPEPLK
jgi:predicted aspartyl protease